MFFWVIPRRLGSNSRRFGTLYRFYLHGHVDEEFFIHLPMKMEPIEGSETSAIRTKTPGNYPKENILHNFYTYFVEWKQMNGNISNKLVHKE